MFAVCYLSLGYSLCVLACACALHTEARAGPQVSSSLELRPITLSQGLLLKQRLGILAGPVSTNEFSAFLPLSAEVTCSNNHVPDFYVNAESLNLAP